MKVPAPSGALLLASTASAAALAHRLWLAPRFFGWEEGDYGDLMMVREVLDSGFTWFRVAHMPLWYALGAVSRLLWPDPRLSALAMTMAASVLTVFIVSYLAARTLGLLPAAAAGAWLVMQPESALYGASTLREPLYAAFAVLGAGALVLGAERTAGAASGLAFLTRMESFFTWMPALALARIRALGWRGVIGPLSFGLGAVVAWQFYVSWAFGEGPFFGAPLGVNFAPDVHGGEGRQWGPWFAQGLDTALALLHWTLPRKLGWTWMILALGGLAAALAGRRTPGPSRVFAFHAAFGLLLWFTEGLLAHHEPNHNLYWTWLLPVVPFLAWTGAFALAQVLDELPRSRILRVVTVAGVVLSGVPGMWSEARYQEGRAERWYRPQLELARWMEDRLPPGTGVLVSSIPECWLKRHHGPLRVFNWWKDIPPEVRDREPEAFGQWLDEHHIDYVLWFREDWTDAPSNAPWLADGAGRALGARTFRPLDREDGYGWILYGVDRGSGVALSVPPKFGHGERGPGWR